MCSHENDDSCEDGCGVSCTVILVWIANRVSHGEENGIDLVNNVCVSRGEKGSLYPEFPSHDRELLKPFPEDLQQ